MDIFERSLLNDSEKQTVPLSASLVNDRTYCLANYVNHAADTPLDTIFEPMRWAA